MKNDVYKCILETYIGKINLACTCKLARVEHDSIKHYTFNEVKQNLDTWIKESNNNDYFKELCLTLNKCNCKKE